MIIRLYEIILRLEGSFSAKDKQGRLQTIKSKLGREQDFALMSETESRDNLASLAIILMAPHNARADQRQAWLETLLNEQLDAEVLDFRNTDL